LASFRPALSLILARRPRSTRSASGSRPVVSVRRPKTRQMVHSSLSCAPIVCRNHRRRMSSRAPTFKARPFLARRSAFSRRAASAPCRFRARATLSHEYVFQINAGRATVWVEKFRNQIGIADRSLSPAAIVQNTADSRRQRGPPSSRHLPVVWSRVLELLVIRPTRALNRVTAPSSPVLVGRWNAISHTRPLLDSADTHRTFERKSS